MRNSMRRLLSIARHRPLIEAEATAAERARIRAAVEGLTELPLVANGVYRFDVLDRKAVLALLEP